MPLGELQMKIATVRHSPKPIIFLVPSLIIVAIAVGIIIGMRASLLNYFVIVVILSIGLLYLSANFFKHGTAFIVP
jgi:hypothetical protein